MQGVHTSIIDAPISICFAIISICTPLKSRSIPQGCFKLGQVGGRYNDGMRAWRVDWVLVGLVVALFGVGLVALYSAGGENYFYVQLQRGAAGAVLMLAISQTPAAVLRHMGGVLFVVVVVLLIGVLVAGTKINNAQRWLHIGFLVQPSELMKIFLPVGLAYGYSLLDEVRWWHHVAALGVVGVPVLLVLAQPDFGTATMIALTGLVTIFIAGIRWWWIGGLGIAAIGSLPVLWSVVLKPYQQQRVLTMLDPFQDPLGAGYHTIQSQIAVGSGGVWGKGFLAGTQTQLGFLPERHTDFIFAVFAEEFGLAGALLMLGLAVLITWRCLAVAARASTSFACYATVGITAAFVLTFFMNLAMVSGLVPVVGMPLPLVSYGGTALLSCFIGFGIVLAFARPRRT